MARIYGDSYSGPDGIIHHPYFDPDTGEGGEDLSLPEPTPTQAPSESPLQYNQPFADAGWDPRAMSSDSQMFGSVGATPPTQAPSISPSGQVTLPPSATPGGGQPQPAPPQPGQPPRSGPSPYEQLLADNAAKQAGNDAAQIAYQNAILQGQRDDRAQAIAQQAWANAFAEKQQEYRAQQDVLTNQRANDQLGLNVLNLNAGLRGPSNYLTYLRTLSNTPAGLTDLVNGLAGRFQMSRQQSSAPGAQYERASVDTLTRDLNDARGGQPNDLSGMPLPAGGQWNANNFNVLSKNPTQLGLTQNLYEESGRDWNTEIANYLGSLPRFSGPRRASVSL